MIDKLNLLQYKITEYQNIKNKNFDINWVLLKDIICILADILISISHELPDNLQWLKSMFLLVGQLLKSLCQSLPEIVVKENRNANTRG